jgi:aminoglycoside phosphotransferase (APT) family kinase protein
MTPDEALARLSAAPPGLKKAVLLKDGAVSRVWRVTSPSVEAVLRIDKPAARRLGLDRAAELQALRVAGEAGLAPGVLAASAADGLLLTRFLPGPAWTPAQLASEQGMAGAARLLRTLHRLPATLPRIDLPAVASRYATLAGDAHATGARATIELLSAMPAQPPCLCHHDPTAGNFIGGDVPRLVDWEYAAAGDPWFDAATVANELPAGRRRDWLAAWLGRPVSAADETLLARWLEITRRVGDLWHAAVAATAV